MHLLNLVQILEGSGFLSLFAGEELYARLLHKNGLEFSSNCFMTSASSWA